MKSQKIKRSTKLLISFFLGATLFVYLVFNFLYRSKATAESKLSFNFLTETVTFEEGEASEIGFNLVSDEGKKISGVDLAFQFDSNSSDLIDFDSFTTLPANYFEETILAETEKEGSIKKLHLVLFTKKNDVELTNVVRVNLKFKVKNISGQNAIDFISQNSQVVGPVLDHYFDIEADKDSVDYQTMSDQDISFDLKLRFQGILGLPKNKQSIEAKVKLVNSQSGIATEDQKVVFKSDNNGFWTGQTTFSEITPGAGYAVYIKGEKHLGRKVCENLPSELSAGAYQCSRGQITVDSESNSLDFSKIMLLSGDLAPQDGLINSYDLSLVRNNLGKTDADSLAKADINLDGVINTQDYSLVVYVLSLSKNSDDND